MQSLDYSRICTEWIPKLLTKFMKEQKLTAAPKILELDKRSTFLSSIATGDKSHSEDSGLPKMRREIYPPPKKK